MLFVPAVLGDDRSGKKLNDQWCIAEEKITPQLQNAEEDGFVMDFSSDQKLSSHPTGDAQQGRSSSQKDFIGSSSSMAKEHKNRDWNVKAVPSKYPTITLASCFVVIAFILLQRALAT